MKKFLPKLLLILLIPILLTFGLCKYVPVPSFEIQKANAAFSSFRVMMGAGISGDKTSYALDGAGDKLTAPDHANWDLFSSTGSTSTIEVFVKFTDHVGSEFIIEHAADDENKWGLWHQDGGTGFKFWIVVSNSIVVSLNGGEVSDINWHHVALVDDSTVYSLYVDGSRVATVTDSNVGNFTGLLRIGDTFNAGSPFDGNLDEIRISDVARYSGATYTVPNLQFISDSNTKLLIHCGEVKTGTTGSGATFTDSGITGHTVTEVGNAIEDTVTYKF